MAAYEGARKGGAAAFEEALARNLYRGQPPDAPVLAAMAGYVVDQIARLQAYDIDALARAQDLFGPPPARPASADEGQDRSTRQV